MMGKLIVELPEHLHVELKKKATTQHRTLKSVITELIMNYLSEEMTTSERSETGLCGRWQDDRTAEEIVREIKSGRRWNRERKI